MSYGNFISARTIFKSECLESKIGKPCTLCSILFMHEESPSLSFPHKQFTGSLSEAFKETNNKTGPSFAFRKLMEKPSDEENKSRKVFTSDSAISCKKEVK